MNECVGQTLFLYQVIQALLHVLQDVWLLQRLLLQNLTARDKGLFIYEIRPAHESKKCRIVGLFLQSREGTPERMISVIIWHIQETTLTISEGSDLIRVVLSCTKKLNKRQLLRLEHFRVSQWKGLITNICTPCMASLTIDIGGNDCYIDIYVLIFLALNYVFLSYFMKKSYFTNCWIAT